jgi:sugar O-acyltransferase (sialic acid O-acetyltransferase NeuD family)
MVKKKVIVLGAGGHARVVIDALRTAKRPPALCLDPERALWGKAIEGVEIAGGDDRLAKLPPGRFALANGVGAPLDTRPRRRIYEAMAGRGYEFPAVVAASATVAASASLADGAQVLARAVVNPGAVVGVNAIVNTGAIVEHDCLVGDHAHVCPGVILCGGVRVGAGAFIGAGAVVLPGVRIGVGAVVGAGVVVRKSVPDGGRALPARRR